jgi:DNA-directed RNA polymerase subunit E'/Rpb7
MSDIISPYINTEYHTKIELYPHQMNNDIYKHLKNNLKNIENKCNKYGYVVRVYKILEYINGRIDPDNFKASAVYDIKFACRICIPNVKTKIICEISKMSKKLMLGVNGPILAIIHNKHINTSNFSIDYNGNLTYIKDNRNSLIKSNDYIKVSVLAARSNKGDVNIKVFGYLEDIATIDEIASYKKDLQNNAAEDLDKNGDEFV